MLYNALKRFGVTRVTSKICKTERSKTAYHDIHLQCRKEFVQFFCGAS